MADVTLTKHQQRTHETRKKILAAAGRLFAQYGFKSVTLRQITSEAGVDLALIKYHFGSKQDLFDEVMMRHAEILRHNREQALLECIRSANDNPLTVDLVIEAYVSPMMDKKLRDNEDWQNYFTLMSRFINAPEPNESALKDFYDPNIKLFVEALRLALPEAREEDLYWCCHFMSGTLSVTFAQTDRLDRVSEGQCQSADWDAAVERLIPFLADGFRSACLPPHK